MLQVVLAGILVLISSVRDGAEKTVPVMVMTGPTSDIGASRYESARSQEAFDALWVEHMGDRVTRAAQGWPMTPTIDFARYEAVFMFGGEATNSNGFRIVEMFDRPDEVLVRFEDISFQTASFDGEDAGVASRPWAMVLIERTEKRIILEQDVRSLIEGDPIWKRRAVFPARRAQGPN